jgi:hypothetical protein
MNEITIARLKDILFTLQNYIYHLGAIADAPHDVMEIGRPYNLPQERFLGSVTQPNFGGCCHPEMHLRSHGQADDAEPFGKVIGPCCFGGWLDGGR